jgi:hypothetical protein
LVEIVGRIDVHFPSLPLCDTVLLGSPSPLIISSIEGGHMIKEDIAPVTVVEKVNNDEPE